MSQSQSQSTQSLFCKNTKCPHLTAAECPGPYRCTMIGTGTYTGFIKAGRGIAVPVVIRFIPAEVADHCSEKLKTTNWAKAVHWKEIKDMLKPAVEAAVSCHNDVLGASEKISRQPVVRFKSLTGFGYKLKENKGKYSDVMDVKDLLAEDYDDEDVDEDTGLRDLGGRFKRYISTSAYVEAFALLQTGSTAEDEKKLNKHLGVKIERNFFLVQNSESSSFYAKK